MISITSGKKWSTEPNMNANIKKRNWQKDTKYGKHELQKKKIWNFASLMM